MHFERGSIASVLQSRRSRKCKKLPTLLVFGRIIGRVTHLQHDHVSVSATIFQ